MRTIKAKCICVRLVKRENATIVRAEFEPGYAFEWPETSGSGWANWIGPCFPLPGQYFDITVDIRTSTT